MSTDMNPFSSDQKTTAIVNAAAESDQQRSITETQAAMVIAKKFPRNQMEAMDEIIQACTRPTLAETALYSYSKGGTAITGPSIRLAETAAQCWGNLQFGVRELDQRDGVSTVEAFAWDLETNVKEVKTFQVPHLRYTRNGSYPLKDPRDIYEMVANQGARRLRACILGVIPGDVIEAAQRQCEVTLKSTVDSSPDAIMKMVETFQTEFGVSGDMIQKRIQCRLEAIRPAQIIQMKKIYASLRDGMSSPSDWFEVEAEQPAKEQSTTASIKEKIRSKKKKVEPKVEPKDHHKQDLQTVLDAINQAKDESILTDAYDLGSDHIDEYPQDEEVIKTTYAKAMDKLNTKQQG